MIIKKIGASAKPRRDNLFFLSDVIPVLIIQRLFHPYPPIIVPPQQKAPYTRHTPEQTFHRNIWRVEKTERKDSVPAERLV